MSSIWDFGKKEKLGIDPKSHLTFKIVPNQNPPKTLKKSQKWQFCLGKILQKVCFYLPGFPSTVLNLDIDTNGENTEVSRVIGFFQ